MSPLYGAILPCGNEYAMLIFIAVSIVFSAQAEKRQFSAIQGRFLFQKLTHEQKIVRFSKQWKDNETC
jgi:hypothetical protein